MQISTRLSELKNSLSELKAGGRTISFVPTMGALHEGHLSLIRTARESSDRVIVSIFVNPLQFGVNEDFSKYPRTPEKDIELLKKGSVDLLWMPQVSEMYSQNSMITVDPGAVAESFEGKIRSGHFQGVLTVVAKLFHQVNPDTAVFGQKDAQQLFLIRKMVEDLNFALKIIEGKTVRESDGLALSSRNVYLKVFERARANVLYRALSEAKNRIESGETKLAEIKNAMAKIVAEVSDFTLDYATAVSENSFQESEELEKQVRLIIAARIGSVRLIDNLQVTLGNK